MYLFWGYVALATSLSVTLTKAAAGGPLGWSLGDTHVDRSIICAAQMTIRRG